MYLLNLGGVTIDSQGWAEEFCPHYTGEFQTRDEAEAWAIGHIKDYMGNAANCMYSASLYTFEGGDWRTVQSVMQFITTENGLMKEYAGEGELTPCPIEVADV